MAPGVLLHARRVPISLSRQQSPRGRHTPNLWPVWLVAPVALLAVACLAYLLYQGADALLAHGTTKPVKANDTVKTTATAFTLIGAVLAGVYAYRKQLLSEGDAHREDARYLAERYSTAAEQLGHEQAAVRLAGVYAMARLADDWPEQRQVCIDVLCAYIRMPYQPGPEQDGFKAGEREVRLTIIRIIRDHLQDPESETTWCGHDLDFTGATFDGGDFSRARFTGGMVNFAHAQFNGGTVNFWDTAFTGGTVNFGYAQFNSGTVVFRGTAFTGGTVSFWGAEFTGGMVDFGQAQFNGGTVIFRAAEFTGGIVGFSNSLFVGRMVDFGGVQFKGGTVAFHKAEFTGGTVQFNRAEFIGGTVDFSGARCGENGAIVSFDGAQVSGAACMEWGPFPVIAPETA